MHAQASIYFYFAVAFNLLPGSLGLLRACGIQCVSLTRFSSSCVRDKLLQAALALSSSLAPLPLLASPRMPRDTWITCLPARILLTRLNCLSQDFTHLVSTTWDECTNDLCKVWESLYGVRDI